MTPNKKLLILSCSTGSGHFRAAEALRLSCEKNYPNIQVLHLDIADYLGWFPYTGIVSAYNFISNFTPYLYKLTYQATDVWLTQKIFRNLAPLISFGGRKFIQKINEFKPDFIISTHYLAQIIIPKDFPAPIDTVITDYHPHKTWLSPKIRYTFVATEEIKNNLAKFKIEAVASGIPIHLEFLKEKNIDELKTKLGVQNNWPVVLLLSRSHEKIKSADIISEIFSNYSDKKINLIVIGSKNKKLPQKNLIIIDRTDNIDDWMRIADIIVTKAGGLTITEAMYLQKPIIIINPIPGQEDYNTAYLEQNHYGIKAHSAKDVAYKIQNILDNPSSINKKSYPNASKIILEKVLE
jgi:processive 1,2-diacylglycerol beta-glucosyltransferase